MNPDTFDLSAFVTANPNRPMLLILPATPPAAVAPDAEADFVQTVLFGEASRDEAGTLTVRIRAQRDLRLRALCFTGSTKGEAVRVQSVFVGDEPVFIEDEGAPVERFDNGPLARVVEGWRVRAGLDLLVVARVSSPARLCVAVIAEKRRCR